jgi:UDP-N-acetylmuramoyl-tripeptide--D-alanyl-D-alanine ligase
LEPPEKTMKILTYGKTTVIDDSYNSNPDGFKAALLYLASFSSGRKRVVITRGMVELAEKSYELHHKIGEEIAFCADELVIISKDFEGSLRSGINPKYRTTVFLKDNPKDLLVYIRSLRETRAVILLENRIPKIVYNEILDN